MEPLEKNAVRQNDVIISLAQEQEEDKKQKKHHIQNTLLRSTERDKDESDGSAP